MSDHACIDISHWQGFPDFEAVAADGVVACIMKATEGTSYIDPNRATNYINATEVGIACCTYHWIKPGGNASDQMQFYLDVVEPVPGERMVIDYEEDGCDLSDLKEAVEALLNDSRQLQITIYSGHLLKEQLEDEEDDFLSINTDLWLAQYTTGTPTWPDQTYDRPKLWQYSESGVIDGIGDTNVDLNRFDGTNSELLTWISPRGAEPMPPPIIPTRQVDVDITADPGIDVLVSINGDPISNGSTRRRLRHHRRRLLIPRGPDLRPRR